MFIIDIFASISLFGLILNSMILLLILLIFVTLYSHFPLTAIAIPALIVLSPLLFLAFYSPIGELCKSLSSYMAITIVVRFLYTGYVNFIRSDISNGDSTASLVLSVSTSIEEVTILLFPVSIMMFIPDGFLLALPFTLF